MKVILRRRGGPSEPETFVCSSARVIDGVLRLDKRESIYGHVEVEHVISIPLDRIEEWKETEVLR